MNLLKVLIEQVNFISTNHFVHICFVSKVLINFTITFSIYKLQIQTTHNNIIDKNIVYILVQFEKIRIILRY